MNDALALLSRRRSVVAGLSRRPGARTPATVETLLRLASRVPDHGKLAPWRFIVFAGRGRERAGRLALELRLADKPDLDEAGRAAELDALLALAARHRGRVARRAARESPGMGAGAVGRRLGDGARNRRRRARLRLDLADRMVRLRRALSRGASAWPRTSASPASSISGGAKIAPEDRPRPALDDIVTYF